MFSFNRNEQKVILLLSAALLIGAVVSYIDSQNSSAIPEFDVQKQAVPVPLVSQQDTIHEERPPINLNKASAKDLQTLPGIGPQIAQRIIDYRTQHGDFETLESLAQVKGIGGKTLERIKPHLTLLSP